jgi:hypothetical protein
MTLGRMIYFFVEDRKLGGISAQNYGVIFVWLDVIAFLVQLAGASITSQTDSSQSTIMIGVHIYMGGIGIQELFIVIFTCLFVKLHTQMLHAERIGVLDIEKVNRGSLNWRWVFYGTYISLAMITVRIYILLCVFKYSMLFERKKKHDTDLKTLLDSYHLSSGTICPRY